MGQVLAGVLCWRVPLLLLLLLLPLLGHLERPTRVVVLPRVLAPLVLLLFRQLLRNVCTGRHHMCCTSMWWCGEAHTPGTVDAWLLAE